VVLIRINPADIYAIIILPQFDSEFKFSKILITTTLDPDVPNEEIGEFVACSAVYQRDLGIQILELFRLRKNRFDVYTSSNGLRPTVDDVVDDFKDCSKGSAAEKP